MDDPIAPFISKEPPGPLYHYTTLEPFLELVREQRIWASNIHFLNDAAEFHHAVQLTQEYLRHEAADADGSIRGIAERLVNELPSLEEHDLYVSAFSSEPDLLSQWRGYGSRYGFSIGFDFRGHGEWLRSHGFILGPCMYDDDQKRKAIDGIYRRCLREHAGRAIEDEQFCRTFLERFMTLAPLLKHSSFREEREWRLISTAVPLDNDRVRFRAGESMIVPYIEFDLSGSDAPSIVEVVIGPNPHMKLSERSARALLERFSPEVAVHVSRIPFREW